MASASEAFKMSTDDGGSMPEQFDPDWEYWTPDPEIADVLNDEIARKSRRVKIKVDCHEDQSTGRYGITGFQYGSHPDNPNTRLARERIYIRESREAIQCAYPPCRRLFYAKSANIRHCSKSCGKKNRARTEPRQMMCPCGNTWQTRNPYRLYCDTVCAVRYSPKMKQCRRVLPDSVKCQRCGNGFYPKASRTRFCSVKCGTAGNGRPRELCDRNCSHCGRLFRPIRNSVRYCGQQCAWKGKREKLLETLTKRKSA